MDFIEKGLSAEQVYQSRTRHGANLLEEAPRRGLFKKFLENFGDPIIRVLLVAFGINLIFALNDSGWYETVGIALAILLATWVSTISMHKSEAAFRKLQEEAANVFCRVMRDGKIALVPVAEVVVGDAVLLQSGDKVPADGEIISGELDLDQSVLNGETVEAHKSPNFASDEKSLKNKKLLFSGSVVCAGEGVMKVTSVGDHTFLGHLAKEIQQETRESPLKVRLTHLAGTISKLGSVGAVLVALSDLFNTWLNLSGFSLTVMVALFSIRGFALSSVLHALTLAVTVIVVAVPEGLPMMITVVLSANMRRMLKDQVLVRTMVGIETAGNVDVLFTDKTGTLTQGQLRVKKILRGDGTCYESAGALQKDKEYWRVLHTSITMNNASSMVDGAPAGGNTTDRALLAFASHGDAPAVRAVRVKSVPFSSDEKYMATEISGDYHLVLVKGAFERILPNCINYIGANGQATPLSGAGAIERASRDLAREGMRVLAVATAPAPLADGQLRNLTFVALIGILDPLRDEAKESVKALTGAGIQVVMITGDSVETAKSIARGAGLLEDGRGVVMTSSDMQKLSDTQLAAGLPNLRVVARALPADKSRLVEIAQRGGSVVGMTGDGVNDAPALKKADVGFAMGSGTEVAKEAGDIVILNDNLSSIVKAVLYGRTIFKTIRKFIVFQLTVNLCAVLISIIAPLIGYDSPVTVLQMLWINMVMDTLAGMAFSGEPALKRYLLEKPLKRDTPVINREMAIQIGVMSAITTCLNVWFLLSPWARSFFRPGDHLMTAFFAVFMYAGIFNSVSARTDRMNLFSHLIENKSFVLIMAFVFLAQTAIIYLGGSLFRAYGLTFTEWIATLALSSLVLPADLIRKAVLKYRRRLRP